MNSKNKVGKSDDSKNGYLYIVATPIGNLDDISKRAIAVLTQVKLILAEDTRHARKLLEHYGISTKTNSFHDQNEYSQTNRIIELLQIGQDIALISDAGTPLINDPGYRLVRAARENGISVSPIPGPSAAIAAISASGIATDRFSFEGFLPAKENQRDKALQLVASVKHTLIFYESGRRIVASLQAMQKYFGEDRCVSVAREMTKKFETFYFDRLDNVIDRILENPVNEKGEFVVVVSATVNSDMEQTNQQAMKLVMLLIDKLPAKTACKISAETFGANKNDLYQMVISQTSS